MNKIVKNIQERQEIAQKRRELKNRALELRSESRATNRAFIKEQMDNFLTRMNINNHSYVVDDDIHGFTKFVNRSNIYLNSEHSSAVFEFNEAKSKLAKVFVKSLLQNKNGEREQIINHASIKNIKDMEFYFQD